MSFKKPPKRPRSKQASSVADIIPTVGQRMGLNEKVSEWSVLQLWDQVVAPMFKETTQAIKLSKQGPQTKLHVRASNPTVAAQLMFSLEEYRQAINAFSPQTGIRVDRIEMR